MSAVCERACMAMNDALIENSEDKNILYQSSLHIYYFLCTMRRKNVEIHDVKN